ncbi:MAG: hypothetical protein NC310_08655 [Roseburia sp.]|nr:hypothetical protein [Anaeroplasma bactoclasticum]MCM1197118.1 hypothetical protein [Roseburia sp.]MCM1557552.1 hypothetical protein [Anaeroplasma bactoclasticum]
MKEYEKLLFEDTKRKETLKAITEIKLGLFEQKEEENFDFSLYTKITYDKKYKGLYDLYQNNETLELVMVCPLLENNKNDYNERKDLTPYAYDCIYLEYLDEEAYALVKQAAVHEKSRFIDVLYYAAIVLYFIYLAVTLGMTIYYLIEQSLENVLILCGALWGPLGLFTAILPMLLIQYRKFKAQ